MNWLVFAITAYVLLAVQTAFSGAVEVGEASPNLLLVLAVFVGTSARPGVVVWALLGLGVLLDLQPGPLGGAGVLVGPHALGMLAGAYVLLQLRGLLFRDSVVTLVVLTLAVGGFDALVEVGVYALRGLWFLAGEAVPWGATEQLGRRLLDVVYSAVVAVPLGLVLKQTRGWWGFGKGRGR